MRKRTLRFELASRSRKLPSVAADSTLTKGGHRLISRSGLGLAVADLLLAALSAGQAGTDTPLGLCDHSFVHVLFLQFLVFGALLITLELFVGHLDKAVGLDGARKDLFAEGGIGLVLEVLEEGTQAGLVFWAAFGLVCVASCNFYGASDGENIIGH